MKHTILLTFIFFGNILLFGQTSRINDEGESLNIRSCRGSGIAYYVDGKKVTTGKIKITLKDKSNKEAMPFAVVTIENTETKTTKAGLTNIDGECEITSLLPGSYNIKATYMGYTPVELNNVSVNEKTVHARLEMLAGIQMPSIEIISYQVPLINVDTRGCSFHIEGCWLRCVSRTSYEETDNDTLKPKAFSFSCYPNPTSGQLFIEMKGSMEELTLMDITGKLVQKFLPQGQEKLEINLSDLSSGIYFLSYSSEGKNMAEKVVVVH